MNDTRKVIGIGIMLGLLLFFTISASAEPVCMNKSASAFAIGKSSHSCREARTTAINLASSNCKAIVSVMPCVPSDVCMAAGAPSILDVALSPCAVTAGIDGLPVYVTTAAVTCMQTCAYT